MVKKKHPIIELIKQGENKHLDFKYEISDAQKIARTLVAFANTDGGTLLIGVKDNGKIAGIRSEEEYYMIEHAAVHFCFPEIIFYSKEWLIEGKKVLEVKIPKGEKVPYKALINKKSRKAFVRIADENILASGVQMKIWKTKKSLKQLRFTNSKEEKNLLTCLNEKRPIALLTLKKTCNLSPFRIEKLLAEFVLLGLVKMKVKPEDVFFILSDIHDTGYNM